MNHIVSLHTQVRWSTANAYLKPALKRDNLTVISKSLVTKIVFEGTKAVGVEYKTKNNTQVARAASEVIVTSGKCMTTSFFYHEKNVGVNRQCSQERTSGLLGAMCVKRSMEHYGSVAMAVATT